MLQKQEVAAGENFKHKTQTKVLAARKYFPRRLATSKTSSEEQSKLQGA